MINANNFYTVQGWMISELGLKGNALAVYAIIYGFSQDGASEYSGSALYLAEWLGCSKKTIFSTLANLTDAGYLIKKTENKNGVIFNTYIACRTPQKPADHPREKISPPGKNFPRGREEISPGVGKNLPGGREKFSPNNIDNNINNNNSYIDKDIYSGENEKNPNLPADPPPEKPKGKGKKKKATGEDKPPKKEYGEFKHVKLTDEEYAKLVKKHGQEKADALVKYLDEYIEEKPKYKSESHYLAICRWVVDAVNEKARRRNQGQGTRSAKYGQPASGPVGPNGITIDPTKTDLDGAFR